MILLLTGFSPDHHLFALTPLPSLSPPFSTDLHFSVAQLHPKSTDMFHQHWKGTQIPSPISWPCVIIIILHLFLDQDNLKS